MRFLRTNSAVRLTVGPFFDKADGITPKTALTVTNEKLTFMVDVNNVPTLVLDTSPTTSGGANDMIHVSGDDAGFYDLELAAADVNYLGRAMLALTDAANHCPVFHEFMILPAVVYDALVLGSDNLDVSVLDIAANAVSAAAIAQDAIDADSLKADGVTKMQAGLALGSALTTLQGNVTSILADYARRTGDYSTAAALSTLQGNVTSILADYARRTGDYATAAAVAELVEALSTLQGDATAIKNKTDNLPADPADESSLEAAISAVSGLNASGVRAALGMAAADLDSQLSNILAAGGAGSGAISWVYNLVDALGAPVADAFIWVTSDIAGLNVLASGRTDAFGNVIFYLDAGTVYVFGRKSGFNFNNPDTEVVS